MALKPRQISDLPVEYHKYPTILAFSEAVGVSHPTIIKYLKNGKIPKYCTKEYGKNKVAFHEEYAIAEWENVKSLRVGQVVVSRGASQQINTQTTPPASKKNVKMSMDAEEYGALSSEEIYQRSRAMTQFYDACIKEEKLKKEKRETIPVDLVEMVYSQMFSKIKESIMAICPRIRPVIGKEQSDYVRDEIESALALCSELDLEKVFDFEGL